MYRFIQWLLNGWKPTPPPPRTNQPVDMLDLLRALGCDE